MNKLKPHTELPVNGSSSNEPVETCWTILVEHRFIGPDPDRKSSRLEFNPAPISDYGNAETYAMAVAFKNLSRGDSIKTFSEGERMSGQNNEYEIVAIVTDKTEELITIVMLSAEHRYADFCEWEADQGPKLGV